MSDTLVKQVKLNIFTDPGTAKEKIAAVDAEAKKLKATLDEGMAVKVDTAAASVKLALLRDDLRRTSTITDSSGGGIFGKLGGLLGSAAGGAGGLLGALPGLGGAASSNPYVAAGTVAVAGTAIAAGSVAITAIASGLAAATAGLGAFAILSKGTFSQLSGDVTAYQNAWQKLQDAQNKAAVDPTKQTLAAVQKAQLNLQATQLGLGQDAGPAAAAINTLRLAYDKLSLAIQPLTFKVITDATKAVTTFLPNLLPFAQAGGQAIDGLLGKVNVFFQSADFKKWVDKFLPIVGPAITAIGDGIGKVTVAVGKFFTRFSSKDDAHAINIVFDTITGALNTVRWTVGILATAFDVAERDILWQLGLILRGAVDAFGWIPGIGPALKTAQAQFDAFEGHLLTGLNAVQGSAARTSGSLGAIAAAALGVYGPTGTGPGGGKTRGLAGGGPASGLTWVGEQGPELLYTPPGSYVYNNSQARGMGGNTYNITVNVPPSANQAEIGRQVVAVIRQFEQTAGKSWRAP